ncbi:MAG: response regulator [Candidatus Micrarchaeaceae archaeon]
MSQLILISIIDDDALVRRSLERLIKSAGFAVESFGSAEDYLQFGKLTDTKALILDMKLPGMSGLDLQSKLTTARRKTPIIFISALEKLEMRTKARQAGAVAFLSKPFTDEALLSSVHSALESSGAVDNRQ